MKQSTKTRLEEAAEKYAALLNAEVDPHVPVEVTVKMKTHENIKIEHINGHGMEPDFISWKQEVAGHKDLAFLELDEQGEMVFEKVVQPTPPTLSERKATARNDLDKILEVFEGEEILGHLLNNNHITKKQLREWGRVDDNSQVS